VSLAATGEELFLDLVQISPETGGRGVAVAIFMGRFILPLSRSKQLLADLEGLIERVEKDTGQQLPAPREVDS